MGSGIVTVRMNDSRPRPLTSWGRWTLFRSPLTRRILALNLLAPVILMVGVFLMDQYREGLIRSELDGLTVQAEMVAAAVGEGAVRERHAGQVEINRKLAQSMTQRLAEAAHIRLQLFDFMGDLVADSRYLLPSDTVLRVTDLNETSHEDKAERTARWRDLVMTWMPQSEAPLPLFEDGLLPHLSRYPEAVTALSGQTQSAVRDEGGADGMVLSVAVPVRRMNQVIGVLLLFTDGGNVERGLQQVRQGVGQLSIVVLVLTVALSLYMAGTVAKPMRKLAAAAERVRRGHGQRVEVPDLMNRQDEIGELARSLQDMTEALWKRMDAIEHFAADVAHEIKNPLTSVRSAVETAMRLTSPDQQKKLLHIIQDDVERLTRLITDISDASRVDAEMSRAETGLVNLRVILETLSEVYNETAAERRVKLVLDLPDRRHSLWVMGLETRIVQVLRNLLDNALSFSPEDSKMTLRVETSPRHLQIALEDEGPGIPADKLSSIFERFYSERPKSEAFGKHSGLGLSISHQIIDAHGGQIWAENRYDPDGHVLGATFFVLLPRPG